MFPDPGTQQHGHITVVREDLLPGGTKARYLIHLFEQHDEVVYATPAYGGAQVALAYCAQLTGKRATLFVAKRGTPHNRTLSAARYGAKVYQVPNGYLNVVQARAKQYCADTGAYYLTFGADMPEAIAAIGKAAATIGGAFEQVWCAAGSGTLVRGLQAGIQAAAVHAVQVGRDPHVGNATVHKHRLQFEQESRALCPFPSFPNYDRKAWELCAALSSGRVLFWNAMGITPELQV